MLVVNVKAIMNNTSVKGRIEYLKRERSVVLWLENYNYEDGTMQIASSAYMWDEPTQEDLVDAFYDWRLQLI